MEFANNIYHSKNVINIKNIEWKLRHHVGIVGLYVVTISDRNDELLNIFHNSEFHKPHMRKNDDFFVVGLSYSKLGAERLSVDIISDCMKEDKSLDLKKFFHVPVDSAFSESHSSSGETGEDISNDYSMPDNNSKTNY